MLNGKELIILDRCKISCSGRIENPLNSCDIPKEKCSLAMAYGPWQKWEPLYDEEHAFHTGTVFPMLDLHFCGRGPER